MPADRTLETVRDAALWLDGGAAGLLPLVDAAAGARVVLIGEASHGTHEFYRLRAELTQLLIERQGFDIVAVEGDWPDSYRAHRWVRGGSADADAAAALGDFQRFPRWMWRNDVVVEFLAWLREFNAVQPPARRCGFYGLDLYSLHASAEAVLEYLNAVDPDAARRARARYGCFDDHRSDPQSYGYAATIGLTPSCENEVVAQLVELRRKAAEYASRDGYVAEEEFFFAEQNARLVRNAERYYRSMFAGRSESWNLRDAHMMETLVALLHFAERRGGAGKAIVWAHNSHLGDARATQMGDWGELNLGQLVRQQFGSQAFSIGFTTHRGAVTAAREWGDPAESRQVRPSLAGSYERLFHEVGLERFLLLLHEAPVAAAMRVSRLERAIGVIYVPETERASHYFRARLADQFDAVIHVDVTSALRPLELWSMVEADLPETYPTGV
jgi:erythromycin esterase-like protein